MRPLLLSLLPLLLACSEYELVGGPVDVDPGEVTECGFTWIEGTSWYRYDCNPVFTTTDEEWAPDIGGVAFAVTRVLEHPFYQMWYVGIPDGDSYGLGYAVSAEGTDWQASPSNPGLSSDDAMSFDRTVFQAPQAEWDPESRTYYILYGGLDLSGAGGDGGIGVISSVDGRSWTRLENNPVLPLTPTNVEGANSWCWPLDLNVHQGSRGGSVFTGYIAGSVRGGACEAWSFSASDLSNLQVDPEKSFAAGASGAWDDQGLISLNTAVLGDDEHLFYVGFGDWDQYDTYRVAKNSFIGEAVRGDDGSWVRSPDPVPVNMTEEGEVSAVAAVTVGNRIAVWITDRYGDTSGVGYFLYDPDKAATEGGDTAGGAE